MSKPNLNVTAKTRGLRRSVSILVGGTGLGNFIAALALPVATRLYSPEDFSVLAVFSSIVFIISVAACLRFDVALTVAETDDAAVNLLVLALIFAILVSIIVGVTVASLPSNVHARLGLAEISPFLWWLPLAIFLVASYGALQGWLVRRSAFVLLSYSRVTQSAATAVGQIGLGWIGVAPLGLLIGFMLNTVVGCLLFGYRFAAKDIKLLSKVRFETLRTTYRAFSKYPKYSTFEALANSASIQLPVVMIAALAIGPEAGHLSLAMTVMQAPMALIGNAIGQVYLSQAPEEYRNGKLDEFTAQTLAGLSRIGIGPLLFAGIVAPRAFGVIFGEDWRRAGEIVAWMTPWFVFQLLSSPLSMAIHVTGRQRLALLLQLSGLILRVLVVWGASTFANSYMAEAYAVSGLIFYSACLIIIGWVVRLSVMAVLKEFIQIVPAVLAWVAVGGMINYSLSLYF